MKLLPLKTSLLALALFAVAGPGIAGAAGKAEPGTMVVAQADDDGASGSQRIEAIKKFLAGGRNLSKLDNDKLAQRLKRAQKLQGTPDLPAELAQGLEQKIAELNDEIAKRQAGGTSAASDSTADSGDQPADAANNSGQASTPAASSGEVEEFLRTVQPSSELDQNALRAQMRKAAQLSKTEGLSKEDRRKLKQVVRDSRAALGKGKDNATPEAPADEAAGTAGNGTDAAAAPAAESGGAAAFIANTKPAAGLNDAQLRKQMKDAAALSKASGTSKDDRKRLRAIMQEARAEITKRQGGTGTGAADGSNDAAEETPAKTADTDVAGAEASKIVVDVVSEKKARDILNDNADAKSMNKAELRKRLATMRDLLAANKLSPATNKALRQKLASERTYLRQEVGKGTGQGGNTTVNNITINNDVTIKPDLVKVVIADRRPSAGLKDDELRIRINVYRKIVIDVNYSDSERQQWRAKLEQDRVILRQRLLNARSQRQANLKAKGKDINIDLSVEFKPGRPVPPRSVFAAEADDQEITDVLAAPPRRKLERKYTIEEVETDPELRDAVARIEIDTVHFGFGEGFLREEEIDNLDRIAEVMEQILAVNPGEVFMIEGHTDAVGSDPANLQLSRERSKAVKQALATYFVIPEENLKTVGFGERYLKIPTPDPEAENRRVSIARITALVGALDE